MPFLPPKVEADAAGTVGSAHPPALAEAPGLPHAPRSPTAKAQPLAGGTSQRSLVAIRRPIAGAFLTCMSAVAST
jgi:hypothetical protein